MLLLNIYLKCALCSLKLNINLPTDQSSESMANEKSPRQGDIMQQMSSSTVSTAESSSSNISENERNKKLEHTEKLRLKRKKIQDERRAKLKEFREKNGSIPKPPDASNPEDAENLRAKKAERSAKLRSMKPDHSSLKIMTREDVERVAAFNRELGWGGNSVQTNAYDISNYMMDPGGEYDEWQQAYRTLGAFVDCDHDWGGSHSGDNNGGDRGCNRWMMWAAVSKKEKNLKHVKILFTYIFISLHYHNSILIQTIKAVDTTSTTKM